MITQNYSVSIAIAAYNEQYTIAAIIADILAQVQNGWSLKEIRVYTDGCTDDTLRILKRIKHSKLLVIEDKVRRGKTYRLNQMFHDFKGDILVMFDADIRLKNNSVITRLLRPFNAGKNIMLVGGNSMPFPPKSFFEKAVYTTFEVFNESRKMYRKGHNIFGCTGSILAIRKPLARTITLPNVINEDAFVYLSCLKKGFEFRYVEDAIIFYRLPKFVSDYVKQVFRSEPKAVNLDLNKYFNGLEKIELHRPLHLYTKSIAKVFIKNPLGVAYIGAVNLLCKPFFALVNRHYKLNWFTASSTKYSKEQVVPIKEKGSKTLAEYINIAGLSTISLLNSLLMDKIFNKTKPFILCYHSVENDSWRYTTRKVEFERQIVRLLQSKRIVSLADILQRKNQLPNTVAITFDDGYIDNLTVVSKILKKYGVPATLFMIGDEKNPDRHELDNSKPLMTISDVKKLHSMGWNIGFHTKTHADLMKLTDSQLEEEIVTSKKTLEKRLGFKLEYLAYPRGAYSQKILLFTEKAGFKAAFTVNGGPVNPSESNFLVNRVPMEAVITGNQFNALITPLGLRFQAFYMSALRWKAYTLPEITTRLRKRIATLFVISKQLRTIKSYVK